VLDGEKRLSEPGTARRLVASLEGGSTVLSSSSMPVRDLEWFACPRAGAPRLLANRGVNGIDGVGSTLRGIAAWAAAAGAPPPVGLLGDLAFLHDLSALVTGAAEVAADARLVVVDNGGGGIFSFLPYAPHLERAVFERAFGTPQGHDVAALAAAFGHRVLEVERPGELEGALAARPVGLEVVVVRSERVGNRAVHRALEAGATGAVESVL
jgi:2-succinyl-5-enolpyruvyl-6-hydroxy-3-cyclohexene-1-carboxylate synthase